MNKQKQKNDLLIKIADLEKKISDLENDLIHDSLTSLKTRAFFEERSNANFRMLSNTDIRKRRGPFDFKNLSILFFDIDYFKKINDTYGHAVGDVVLREVAQVISGNMRQGDIVARWGGDEIVAMLPGAKEINAKKKADDIRKKIEMLIFDSAPDLKVTISIGIANAKNGLTPKEIMIRADKALYKAKETGRNKAVVYSGLLE